MSKKPSFKQFKIKHYINYIALGLATVIFAILGLSGALPNSIIGNLVAISISMILAVSLSLVVGFLGELSLGHAGFMCVGAYLGGKLSAILVPIMGNGIPALMLSILVGGLCAGICGFIIGLPTLRLKGDYLAITTLAFGEIVKTIFQNTSTESFGGAIGLPTPRFDSQTFYIICLVMVIITVFVVQNLIRSKHGRAITAIRDNEIAAKATGINVTKYKLMCFVTAAVFAGIAGVLFSYSKFTVSSTTFDYNYSIEILVMVVLGGMGNITGSLVAAAAVTFLNAELQTILTGDLAVLKDLIYALILILIVIYNNAPAFKKIRDKLSFSNLFKSKRRQDPSYNRDDTGRWDVVPTKIKMDAIISTDLKVENFDPDKPDKPENSKEETK